MTKDPGLDGMADTDDYLQEGFDPRSVTIPRLRSILVTHNIDYPSTAKKPQLVQLVADHVMPQVPKLRTQRARAKRSSYGIVNAGSAEDTNTWDDHELPPPRPAPRRSVSPRKSSARIRAQDQESDTASHPRSALRRSSRSASRQLSHADADNDSVSEVSRPTRRSRRIVTPQMKSESDEGEEQAEELQPPQEESVFTDDNPFQSGSSPAAVKSPAHRRRTTGEDVLSAKLPRRRTDGVTDPIKTSRSFEVPAPRLCPRTPDEFLDAGEEFTPDEQLELERAASQGELTIVPRKSPSAASSQTSFKVPLFVLLLALLSAYGAWYRQEKIAVGYCGLGRPAKELLPPEVPVPDFLVPFVEPQCEQCPQHAYCYQEFSVRCEPDFILKPHPLSLGGLVPLPPSCEPDSDKARRMQAVTDKAVEELRGRRAKFECGELVDEVGEQEQSPAVAEQELKETVSKQRNKRMNDQEFDELWAAAIGEVTSREEVVVEVEETETE